MQLKNMMQKSTVEKHIKQTCKVGYTYCGITVNKDRICDAKYHKTKGIPERGEEGRCVTPTAPIV